MLVHFSHSSTPMPSEPKTAAILPNRYRRVRRFFIRALIHAVWWDIILKLPGLRLLRKPPVPRWQAIARRYRKLALDLGGVLIKLGQFLSIRVDVLPVEITRELADLQDEVPPEPFDTIRHQIETDLNRPVDEIFAEIDAQPLGSASLAQVHLAKISAGEDLAIKVLRPDIESVVETDLSAIRMAVEWLKFHKAIRRRVDLDWIVEEFATVTRNELNLTAEGKNAERFAADFKHDPNVVVPRIYWEYSAGHTLAMENVGGIKITDIRAMENAGIQRAAVAQALYDIYMKQVFETYFVHADPHPGNLFVIPLSMPDETGDDGPDSAAPEPLVHQPDRPFQIAFVDFGMMAVIPERMRSALRDYAIGVGTRDVYRIVQAYIDAGVLLPDADVKLIEEAHEMLFRRFWGVRMADLKDTALAEIRYFMKEYREVIFEAPFQFQADLLFIMRAMGILSGMATHLDPDFDVWSRTIPYAERYAKEKLKTNRSEWRQEIEQIGQMLFKMPSRVDRVLSHIERGDMMVQSALAPGTRKAIHRLETAITRLGWMIGAIGFLLTGAIFTTQETNPKITVALFFAAALMFIGAIRKK